MNEAQNRTIQSYRVIAAANDIVAAANNMETGMRGYLLAGKEAFLEPYTKGVSKLSMMISRFARHRER